MKDVLILKNGAVRKPRKVCENTVKRDNKGEWQKEWAKYLLTTENTEFTHLSRAQVPGKISKEVSLCSQCAPW